MIHVVIPGKPAPMPRTRPARGGRMIWPKAYRIWREAAHVLLASQARQERWAPVAGPVGIEIVATWPRPRQRPAWMPAEVWATGLRARRPVRPDGDNVAKTAADTLNGLAYADDGQITDWDLGCWVAARGEAPSTTIIVRSVPWLREAP